MRGAFVTGTSCGSSKCGGPMCTGPKCGGSKCGRPEFSKGAVGHDNVTFEGGLVIFVCQVPWTPGKVPSTPAVLRCPSARWIAPFSAGVAPFFPKSYAHLRMVTPFTEGVTPFADGLRSFPRDSQGLRRPTPLPRVGGSFAMHVGSARRGDEGVFFLHAL